MALAGAEVLIYPTAIGYELADDTPERGRQRDAWIISQRGHARGERPARNRRKTVLVSNPTRPRLPRVSFSGGAAS